MLFRKSIVIRSFAPEIPLKYIALEPAEPNLIQLLITVKCQKPDFVVLRPGINVAGCPTVGWPSNIVEIKKKSA